MWLCRKLKSDECLINPVVRWWVITNYIKVSVRHQTITYSIRYIIFILLEFEYCITFCYGNLPNPYTERVGSTEADDGVADFLWFESDWELRYYRNTVIRFIPISIGKVIQVSHGLRALVVMSFDSSSI